MLVNNGLSRSRYINITRETLGAYPCYSSVQKEKKKCYPESAAFTITDTEMAINLQKLLDVTMIRLAEFLRTSLNALSAEEKANLRLISKWGMDGSSQDTFKPRFEDSTDSDSHVLQSYFVPLILVSRTGGKKITLWRNPAPSSPRFCRPIRFRFVKENEETICEEHNHVQNQIDSLENTVVPLCHGIITVKHELKLTMVGGKVCNYLTDTLYTLRCFMCKATSSQFRNISEMLNLEIDPETLQFGMSVLHARLRFLEFVLTLVYRIPAGT